MIRRPPRSTQSRSSAASDVYKRQIDVGPQPAQPILLEAESPYEGRGHGGGVECRAVVVDETGERVFAGARAAADGVLGLQDANVHAAGGESESGSEPVGPAADYDCIRHTLTVPSIPGAM